MPSNPQNVLFGSLLIFSLQSSFHTTSLVAPPSKVRVVEEDTLRLSAYGLDEQSRDTEELLATLYNRFGPVTSFTGTYRADEWVLNISREDPDNGDYICNDSQKIIYSAVKPITVQTATYQGPPINFLSSLQIASLALSTCQIIIRPPVIAMLHYLLRLNQTETQVWAINPP